MQDWSRSRLAGRKIARMLLLAAVGFAISFTALTVWAQVAAAQESQESQEDELLWSQRYASPHMAPEMAPYTSITDVWAAIYDAFEANGWPIGYGTAVRLAICESSLNPRAISPDGLHRGLYQFSNGTWGWASVAAGHEGASVYDPRANAGTAAWLMAHPEHGGTKHWRYGCTYVF